MSYTVTVKISDKVKRNKVLIFMEKHHKTLKDLFPTEYSYDGPWFPQLAYDNLSYDGSKNKIGFDYGPGFIERHYIYCLIKWMAIHCGDRKIFKVEGKKLNLPYYRYDGLEDIAIFLKKEYKNLKDETLTEMDGWTYEPEEYHILKLIGRKNYKKIVKAHLAYLTEQWAVDNVYNTADNSGDVDVREQTEFPKEIVNEVESFLECSASSPLKKKIINTKPKRKKNNG